MVSHSVTFRKLTEPKIFRDFLLTCRSERKVTASARKPGKVNGAPFRDLPEIIRVEDLPYPPFTFRDFPLTFRDFPWFAGK